MTSANPATPLTRAEFKNACTSVLQGLDCLARQRALIDDNLAEGLQELGRVVSTLQPEIDNNKEYYVDGPLVRFLTAHISKAKAVIQEIKRTCSERSANYHGVEYCKDHSAQHLQEILAVLNELNDFYKHTVFRQDTQFVDNRVARKMTPSQTRSANSRVTFADQQPGSGTRQTPNNTAASTAASSDRYTGRTGLASPSLDQPVQVWTAGSVGKTADPSTPGAFEHIRDMTRKDVHLENWPKDDKVPPSLMDRTRPPLVHPGLRDVHNYRNLPQFTGINLPVKQVPVGELALPAPHVPHWDYHNNCRY
ncbi:uncharacterized protein LOC110990430 [Acanthaster planci]|uniref:Uncharacterized protein LOC110990430 n=1 Tax=Acanthaster planci TaxID=133434 RepID=A0A8B8A0C4_ACAPL|nr:uncharacterized protein LOC110990430 [Acanthaster planci]